MAGKLASIWMGVMHRLETIVEIRVLARQGKSIGKPSYFGEK